GDRLAAPARGPCAAGGHGAGRSGPRLDPLLVAARGAGDRERVRDGRRGRRGRQAGVAVSALGAGPRSHIAELTRALRGFDEQAARAESWGTRLAARLERGSKLLVAGNGGSAAEAQHLSAELLGRFRNDRRPL